MRHLVCGVENSQRTADVGGTPAKYDLVVHNEVAYGAEGVV